MDARTRLLLITLRRALIAALGAIEDVLQMDRSVPCRRDKQAA